MSMTATPEYDEADLLPYFNQSAASHRAESKYYNDEDKKREKRAERINRMVDTNADDAEIINSLKQLFFNARAYRRPLVHRWNKNYRMLRGRYWSQEGRSEHLPSPSPPEILPIVRSTVGWMTDRRFHHTVSVAASPFSSQASDFFQMSKDLETVMDSSWHVNNEEGEVTISLWDAYQFGNGILKTCWNNALAGGMGDAMIERIDPFGFYPDPAARNCKDGNYYFEVKNMSLQELDRRFPGAWNKFGGIGDFIEDFDEMPNNVVNTGPVPRANPGALNGASGVFGQPGQGSRVTAKGKRLEDDGVTVFECWIREHERYEVDVIDPEDPKGHHKEQHTADMWRVIVFAGNHVLLNCSAEDIWSHGQHPYSRFVPFDLGEFWGISLVELLSSTQESINRLLAAAIQNIELTGNPVFKESMRSGISRTQIVNKPGQRIPYNGDPQSIGWLEPPNVQHDIPLFLNYLLQRMETISGLSAITKGQNPSGRPAEGTMDAVQEAAFVGIRMALRSLEYTLRDAGNKKASLIIENYTVPRMVAIAGQGATKSTLMLRGGHFMVPTSKGKVPMEYQLLVDAGAGTDTSRKVREDKAIQLFTLGALDVYSLLEALQIPNRDEVYQRVVAQMQSGVFSTPR